MFDQLVPEDRNLAAIKSAPRSNSLNQLRYLERIVVQALEHLFHQHFQFLRLF